MSGSGASITRRTALVWRMAVCVVISLLAAGCGMNAPDKADIDLKVMVESTLTPEVNSWLKEFARREGVELTIVETSAVEPDFQRRYEGYGELFRELAPDVYVGNPYFYERLAGEGVFLNLDALAIKDLDGLTDFHAPVLDWIRGQSGGALLALAPTFDTQVLFYNAELFETYGVPLPHDQMTWAEVWQLAARFAGIGAEEDEGPVYGFYDGYGGGLSSLVDLAQSTAGLTFLEWSGNDGRVVFDTPSWERVYETALAAHHSGAVLPDNPSGESAYALFKKGRIAMMTGSYALYRQMSEFNADMRWGIVTQPVDDADRESGALTASWLAAVSADSPQQEAAWQLLRYLCGADWAARFAGTAGGLQVRSPDSDGELRPFYMLRYRQSGGVGQGGLPPVFFAELAQLRRELLRQMADGEIGVSEGLQRMERSGQQLLELHGE